jgi:hypothetical protein
LCLHGAASVQQPHGPAHPAIGAELRSSAEVMRGRAELPKSALNIEDFATVRPAFG